MRVERDWCSILIILSYPQVRLSILHIWRKWHGMSAFIHFIFMYVLNVCKSSPFTPASAVHYVRMRTHQSKNDLRQSRLKTSLSYSFNVVMPFWNLKDCLHSHVNLPQSFSSIYSWCRNLALKHFLQIISHIAVPISDSFQDHIQVSIYQKCLVMDLSLLQSLSQLDRNHHHHQPPPRTNTHLIWGPVRCPGVSNSRSYYSAQTVNLHRQSASNWAVCLQWE